MLNCKTLHNHTLKSTFFFLVSLLILSMETILAQGTAVYDTSNSGLPDNNVVCIGIDQSNNKWIGTVRGGLAKFDDREWTVYDTSNSELPEFYVGCIAIDSSNTIWMGSSSLWDGFGLVKFDGTNWTVYDTTNSEMPGNYVFWIEIDASNNKWIGTDQGLAKFDGLNWTVYDTTNSGIPRSWVWRFDIDDAGNKWFYEQPQFPLNKSPKLIKLDVDDETWTTFTNPETLIASFTDDIVIDASNNIWLLSEEFIVAEDEFSPFLRLLKFDGNNWTVYYDPSPSYHGFSPFSMNSDAEGNIWIVTRGDGLRKFDGENWVNYLPDRGLESMVIDKFNNKWIGTNGSGLVVFNENGIVSIDETEVVKDIIISGYHLSQNYPNPFNPSTSIEFRIPSSQFVTLKIYNLLGQEVTTLVSEKLKAGKHQYIWNAGSLASGIYLYRLQAGVYVETKKMILIR